MNEETNLRASNFRSATPAEGAVLVVDDLKVHIPTRRNMGPLRAVDGVSFEVARGKTLGIVGESGCGKSTTARAIMRLQEPTAGSIQLLDTDITHLKGEALRAMRRHCQMVFQDPYSALNPRLTVGQIVSEPLQAQGVSAREIRGRVDELLELVGLHPRHRNSFAHQFSGGQRQRIGTARALSTRPEVLILDEPVSALDVSVQAQVVNLFQDLQSQFDIAMVFISHDLSVVRHTSDEVAVMYLGQIVERGSAESVLTAPMHPYTEALLSAVPRRDGGERKRIVLSGEVPSPINPPPGCRFRSRCWKATSECGETPKLAVPVGGDHQVACFHPSL